MSNQIFDPQNNDTLVDVGNGSLVSMQTVQHIYNEITGRSEELSRNYKINHCTTYDDIKQLYIKIIQLCEQYNIVSKNCSVTLYHLDDQKQVFSSFERFELYDRTTLSPVENIRIEFNFLILLPQQKKPQSYQIEINVQSRATIAKRIKQESSFHSDFLFGIIQDRTAMVEIRYIDYTVARTFQVAIDGWFKGLSCSSSIPFLNQLKRRSEDLPLIFRFATVLAFIWACLSAFSPDLAKASIGSQELYLASTITFGGATLLSMIVGKIGSVLANAVQRLQPTSFLCLTRGDEIAKAEFLSDNRAGITKFVVGSAVAVIINVASAWITFRIGIGG